MARVRAAIVRMECRPLNPSVVIPESAKRLSGSHTHERRPWRSVRAHGSPGSAALRAAAPRMTKGEKGGSL